MHPIRGALGSVVRRARLAQSVAYDDLGTENLAPTTAACEQQAESVIEFQLDKARTQSLSRNIGTVLREHSTWYGIPRRSTHLSAAATAVGSAGGACEANVSAMVAQAVPAAEIH
jgi:hypothetical protein